MGHVIGTTGFDDDDLAAIAAAAKTGHIVRAGNMSLGVNLLVTLARQVASALGEDYDIEIVEAHHRHKVDAPSGTALMLGEAVADGRGRDAGRHGRPGRDGITGARRDGAIGFHAIRGGDFIGEHDVIFAGPGERVTLRHVASDRALFARGALRAAMWLAGARPANIPCWMFWVWAGADGFFETDGCGFVTIAKRGIGGEPCKICDRTCRRFDQHHPRWPISSRCATNATSARWSRGELTRFGVRLQVLPQGKITGRGFGFQVDGRWEWRDGYFCRTLEFGGSGDGYNCQLVLRDGATLRFVLTKARANRLT